LLARESLLKLGLGHIILQDKLSTGSQGHDGGIPMTVTITIPLELEDKIAERAAAKGVTLEEYAQEVLERDAEMPTLRELFAPVRDQIKAAGVTDEELSAQIEEAVSEVRARPRG